MKDKGLTAEGSKFTVAAANPPADRQADDEEEADADHVSKADRGLLDRQTARRDQE